MLKKNFKNYFYNNLLFYIFSNLIAEEEEIYLKSISDQIQVITKDLKTLEKAVYQKSDITSSTIGTSKNQMD